VITVPKRYTRTDGQTTCDRNTALCTKVHRAVKKVNVSIVSIALSQLCDLRVGAHLRLHGPEPAVSCRHS